jgi:hypothetical protein
MGTSPAPGSFCTLLLLVLRSRPPIMMLCPNPVPPMFRPAGGERGMV